jgi:hypothetical protein
MAGRNVVCQARIPALELWPESAVECPRAHLEQQVCATLGGAGGAVIGGDLKHDPDAHGATPPMLVAESELSTTAGVES